MLLPMQEGLWHDLEYLFLIVDLVILAVLILYRRLNLPRIIVWFAFFICLPIITFGAYLMIGIPLFLRAKRPRPSDTKFLERMRDDSSGDQRGLELAYDLCRTGSMEYSEDSTAEYIDDGVRYYERLFKDLQQAKNTIEIECYLIRRDKISREFLNILCRKSEEGVHIRITFDDFGYDGRDLGYVNMLKKSGVECGIFHNMTLTMFTPRKNYRNHRKIIVIDGRVAYCGGYNFGKEYLGQGEFGTWRDSALRITGPQASSLRQIFYEDWTYTTHKKSVPFQPSTHIEAESTPMVVVPGNPVEPRNNPYRSQVLSMIKNAKKELLIRTPYLAPSKDIMKALCSKARSGIKVCIMMPSAKDQPTTYWINRWCADKLIAAGVKVFEYCGGFSHTKEIICDDFAGSVGSANLDMRSLNLDFECNIVVFSRKLVSEVRAAFNKDLEQSREYTRGMFKALTTGQKLRTFLSLIFYSQA